MSSKVYGPLRLPESAPEIRQYPTVEPLPAANSAVPRRTHDRGICPFLSINGQSVDVSDFRKNRRTFGIYGHDIKNAQCAVRHSGVTGDYVLDVCTTSWHNNPRNGDRCPFLPEITEAAPPRPIIGTRTCRKCSRTMTIDKFVRYESAQGYFTPGHSCLECYSGPRRAVHPPGQDEEILAAYRAGVSAPRIAKRLRIHHSYVYRLIAKIDRQEAA